MPTARQALLDAALRALDDGPWCAVRMVDVAALAGVSRQTLHNEFGTKDGLAEALLRRAADGYLAGVDRALTAPAPDRPAAVALWTVRAARGDALVKALLTGHWAEGLPRPDHAAGLPGAYGRRATTADPRATARAGTGPDGGRDARGRRRARRDRVTPRAVLCDRPGAGRRRRGQPRAPPRTGGVASGGSGGGGSRARCPGARGSQWAEPDSWRPITPMITSEIDTSFRVETTSPRKIMP